MNEIVSWLATAVVVCLIPAVLAAVASLRRVPLAERPETPIFDRLGRQIGITEKPDYHVDPGEDSRDGPDQGAGPDAA